MWLCQPDESGAVSTEISALITTIQQSNANQQLAQAADCVYFVKSLHT
ncbi:MAG: hypothetical protein M5U34_19190 [Chloroflexi bacterium]|jgi:hypothetical protein|nr:hypothetical protein [Chloroflexota bacterium]